MTETAQRYEDTRRTLLWRGCLGFLGLSFLFASAGPAWAQTEQQQLVDKAKVTFTEFVSHPDMTWLADSLPNAKAVMIVPSLIKAGFVFGGSGGNGVLLLRGDDGTWSHPVFNVMGSVTFGFQIGGGQSEVVMLVLSDRGVDAMLSTEFKLGGDVSVAAGPVGAGTKGQTADVVAYSRDKGLFAGLTIEGAVINPKADWNAAYYGRSVRPVDILIERTVSNPGADGLRAALAAGS